MAIKSGLAIRGSPINTVKSGRKSFILVAYSNTHLPDTEWDCNRTGHTAVALLMQSLLFVGSVACAVPGLGRVERIWKPCTMFTNTRLIFGDMVMRSRCLGLKSKLYIVV